MCKITITLFIIHLYPIGENWKLFFYYFFTCIKYIIHGNAYYNVQKRSCREVIIWCSVLYIIYTCCWYTLCTVNNPSTTMICRFPMKMLIFALTFIILATGAYFKQLMCSYLIYSHVNKSKNYLSRSMVNIF